MVGDPRESPFADSLVELAHVFTVKRGLQCEHLVNDAAERPNIALEVVGLVFPDLRRSIVGSSCLGIIKAFITGDF